MVVDLVTNGPCPLRPAAHSWQHVKTPLAAEFRTARILRWAQRPFLALNDKGQRL